MIRAKSKALSQSDPFNRDLRQPLLGPIVELVCARAFMCRHLLSVLKRTTVRQLGRDPGRPERVIADRRHDPGRRRPPADHAPGIGLAHGLVGQRVRVVPARGAEQQTLAVPADAGRTDIGVQRLGKGVVSAPFGVPVIVQKTGR
jgi:hypothetical protein